VKVIIDAYNVFHYVKRHVQPAGSLTLASFVATVVAWSERMGHQVVLVFDGTVPRGFDPQAACSVCVQVQFVGPARTADDAIIEFIDSYSAPRTVLVVSSDREIRRAAKRRRCKELVCEAFWQDVTKVLDRPTRPGEPREKRSGLSSEQLDYWLKQFGIE